MSNKPDLSCASGNVVYVQCLLKGPGRMCSSKDIIRAAQSFVFRVVSLTFSSSAASDICLSFDQDDRAMDLQMPHLRSLRDTNDLCLLQFAPLQTFYHLDSGT